MRQFERYDRLDVSVVEAARTIAVRVKEPIILSQKWPPQMGELTADQQNKMEEEFVNKFYEKASAFFLEIADKVDLTDISEKGYGGIYFVPKRQGLHADLFGINLVFNLAFKYNEKNAQQVDAIKRFLNFLNQTSYYHNLENIAFRAFHEVYGQDLKESKKSKTSDKMLFESWRRYLVK